MLRSKRGCRFVSLRGETIKAFRKLSLNVSSLMVHQFPDILQRLASQGAVFICFVGQKRNLRRDSFFRRIKKYPEY